jgi:hypothetical protein
VSSRFFFFLPGGFAFEPGRLINGVIGIWEFGPTQVEKPHSGKRTSRELAQLLRELSTRKAKSIRDSCVDSYGYFLKIDCP